MAAPRHARTLGRVAVLALCCLLVADEDAEARRAHRAKIRSAPAPVSEFTGKPNPPGPIRFADTRFEPVAFDAVDGWAADDHAAAFATFLASCRPIAGSAKVSRDTRPVYPALVEICRKARSAGTLGAEGARNFFEENFRAVRVSKIDDPNGFLTGYYEPIVEGSRVQTDDFKVPLYGRPRDLVHMGRKRKAESFPNTGRVVRRLARGKYVPYFDRAAIEDGALATRNLEICYLKDANDLLFIQIQGSARVRLTDSSLLRVNYDAHNGYPYTPVGRILIERGIIAREDMSMDRIRKWMAENPDGGKELRRQNRSYVFFRNTGLPEHEEARGAQGVPLTAARSIAVDRALHVYGTPFFIEAELPIATETSNTKFRRLMVAQDTGSAIVGPARADIYFGAGDEAGKIAGRIKNPARFTMLMPRALDPLDAGRAMPLPAARPASAPKPAEPKPAEVKAQPATAEPKAAEQKPDVPLPRPRPKS
ncbi:MAG: rane-bound lytic murein transglycosylase [Hyphomicrobiales bacterium]|jgi:membrane-bound lytic murein transglycosylase A|nr:rane-bound lytic murein transglycosylase [Hyphomicrobiales bacterium]